MRLSSHLYTAVATLAFALGCGGGSGSGGGTIVSNPPKVIRFEASQSAVSPGGQVSLMIEFANGDGTIDHGIGTVMSGTSVVVSPASQTTYTLVVTNPSSGAKDSRSASVDILPYDPIITTPAAVFNGQRGYSASTPVQAGCTYEWTVSNGAITAGAGSPKILFSAGQVGTLTLSCVVRNQAGRSSGPVSASCQVIETVVPSFSPAEIFGPDRVHYSDSGYLASVPDLPGTTHSWEISGSIASGRISLGSDQPVAEFEAGSGLGGLVLTVRASDSTGHSSVQSKPLQVVADEFIKRPQDAVSRAYAASATLASGRIFVCGGVDASTSCLRSSELFDPATGHWLILAPMMTARQHHTATLLNDGRVLVIGGQATNGAPLSGVEIYDPHTNTWVTEPSMSSARFDHSALLLRNGMVLVAGGGYLPSGDSVECFDPCTHSWTSVSPMNLSRYQHTSQLMEDGSVLVVGGFSGTAVASAESFEPATGAWSVMPPMAFARTNHTSTLLSDGRLFVSGGTAGIAPSEIYHPGSRSWTKVATAVGPRAGHRATRLPSGRILLTGGMPYDVEAEIYDPATDSWTSGGVLSATRNGHVQALLGDGRVLVVGGQLDSDATEIFDPTVTTWTRSNVMSTTRSGPSATLLPDGSLLMVGGTRFHHLDAHDDGDRYDPATDRWMRTSKMSSGRAMHTATLLDDGRVLVAGGWNGGSPIASSEFYDPSLDLWVPAGDLFTEREFARAVRLSDGSVLIVGGETAPWPYFYPYDTSIAERFDPKAGNWSMAGALLTKRFGHTANRLMDGKVLVVGGVAGAACGDYITELYDPVLGTWSTRAPLQTGRSWHASILLTDGRVLVVGGNNCYDIQASVATAEIYDPRSDRWTAIPSMTTPRTNPILTLLPDGKVLVVGGVQRISAGIFASPANGEIYDPVLNAWQSPGNLPEAYSGDSATLLGNGKVLVVGGQSTRTDFFKH